MRTLSDKRLYTRYERFKAGERIFDYIFENCIPAYDELLISKHNDCSIYSYTIKDISINILLNKESEVFYDLSYKDLSQKRHFSAPNETIDFKDYKEILTYFFDKLLYAVYLSATDPSYKAENVNDIYKTYQSMLRDK